MNEELRRLAIEAGIALDDGRTLEEQLESFAQFIADDCAHICQTYRLGKWHKTVAEDHAWNDALRACSEAIRVRYSRR